MATKKSSKESPQKPDKPRARKPVVEKAREIVEKVKESLSASAAPLNVTITETEQKDKPGSLPLQEIVTRAWMQVKDKSDPVFEDCQPVFKSTLLYHARGVLSQSGAVMLGDTQLARFEQAVNNLRHLYKGEI